MPELSTPKSSTRLFQRFFRIPDHSQTRNRTTRRYAVYWIFCFVGGFVVLVFGGFLVLNAKVNQDVKKCRREMSGSH
jgi:hypothetical protein